MLVIEFFQVVEFLIKGILFVLGILLNHIDAVVYQFGYCIFSGLFGIFLNFLNGLGVSLPLTLQFLDIVIGVVKTLRSCSSNFFLDILHGFNETVIDGYSEFIFKNRFGAVVSAHCINRAIERICRDYNKEEKEKTKAEQLEPVLIPRFTVHQLRHTFCTRFCKNETNIKVIQEIMGHADTYLLMLISIIIYIYTKFELAEKLAEA